MVQCCVPPFSRINCVGFSEIYITVYFCARLNKTVTIIVFLILWLPRVFFCFLLFSIFFQNKNFTLSKMLKHCLVQSEHLNINVKKLL